MPLRKKKSSSRKRLEDKLRKRLARNASSDTTNNTCYRETDEPHPSVQPQTKDVIKKNTMDRRRRERERERNRTRRLLKKKSSSQKRLEDQLRKRLTRNASLDTTNNTPYRKTDKPHHSVQPQAISDTTNNTPYRKTDIINPPNHLSLRYANKRLMLAWQRPLNSQGTHQDVNSYIVFVSRKDKRDWQKLAELPNFNYCVPQMYWDTSVAHVIGVVASKDIHVSPMATLKLPFHGLHTVSVDLIQEENGSFEVTDHYMVEEDGYKTLTYILSVVPMDVKHPITWGMQETPKHRFGTCMKHFFIGSAMTKMIQMSKDRKGISNVEIHLRFCEYDSPLRPCKDCVPDCVIRLGEHMFTCGQKANGEQSNVHRPLDITKECLLGHQQKNIITVEFSPMEIKKYCMFITVVKRLEVRSIVQRLLKDMPSIEEARHYIQDKMQSDSNGVQSTGFKAKLICPIGQSRLVTPCRGDRCSHIMCIEAETLFKMNEGKSVKKCLICQTPYSNIVVDKLFLHILKKVPPCVTEVEFRPDGSWSNSNNGTEISALTIDKEDIHADLLEDDTDFDSENDDWLEIQSFDEIFPGGSTGSITSVPEVLTKLQYNAEDCSAIKCGEKIKAEISSEIEKEVVGVRPIQMFANSCWPVSTSAANAALLTGPSRYKRKRNSLTANNCEITSLVKQTPKKGSQTEAIQDEKLLKSTGTELKDESHAAISYMEVFKVFNSPGRNNKAKQLKNLPKQEQGKQKPTPYYKQQNSHTYYLDKLISNTFKCSSCAEEFPLTKMYEKCDTRVCTDCALKKGFFIAVFV